MLQVLGLPFLMCLILAAMLGYLGLHVLRREIIFIDIALAQLAAVGAIVAHVALHAHANSVLGFVVSLAFVLLASLFYAFARRRAAQIPIEAVIGVSYAISAAAALFLVGVVVGGHMHVQHMLAGSILWVTWPQLATCVAAFAVVGALFGLFRGPMASVTEDYAGAVRAGASVVLWDFLFYCLCGVVITLAVQVAGIVLVFAMLIIPATISAIFTAARGPRLLIAWGAGAGASALGLAFAYRADFSMGPSVAMFLGAGLALAAICARCRSRTLAVTFAGAPALLLAGLVLPGSGANAQKDDRPGGPTPFPNSAHIHGHTHEDEAGGFRARAARAATADELMRLYALAPDEQARSDLASRALETDTRTGVLLALRFLRGNPPLFFRQTVVEAVERATGRSHGFVIEEPFEGAANQAAARKLASAYGLEMP